MTLGVAGAWWLPWSSKPVRPDDVGLGGFDSHTLPPPGGVSDVVTRPNRPAGTRARALLAPPLALLLALAVGPTPSGAQRPDTTRFPADTGVPPERRPPISPRRAFLSSLVLPGYGQSALGRTRSGAILLAFEAVCVFMVRETQLGVREARRSAADSVLVAYVGPNGAPAVRHQRTRFPVSLIRTREEQVEDWIAVLVANHLFAAADAFVAALLWDLPGEVAVNGTPRSASLGLRLRW